MNGNLDLWDKVARVPKEHLKEFKRGGGFTGTAIKPMWSFKTMTDQFGPCGIGWGIDQPVFDFRQAQEETLVFCTVSVWHGVRENKTFGVGGDKIVGKNKYGLSSDDEGCKKAFTDAVTNALKFIGVGADIHMGLWDGNKYIDEQKEQESPPRAASAIGLMPAVHNATKAATRQDMQQLCKEIGATTGLKNLKDWYEANVNRVEDLNDDFKETVRNSYIDQLTAHRDGLRP